jgi:uncharacterized protein with PIN domain
MDQFLLVFIIILLYVLILFIIRNLGIGSKKSNKNCNNYCPDCKTALNRVKRISNDKIIYHLTFRVFDSKRYICNECGWEGLRWEDKYRPGNN